MKKTTKKITENSLVASNIPYPTKVILEFYMEIWYCYAYENGSMANPLFTTTSYELADAEAKDAGYEVVQVIAIELEDEQVEGFTGGEWVVCKSHIVDKDAPGLIIASCNLFRNNWEANARLIAAAPDMYYALKDAEKRLEMLSEADCFDKEDGECLNEISAILNRINKQ